MPEAGAYRSWLDQGMQAGMGYMENNRPGRGDVRSWYPEARSVLLLGFSYGQEEKELPEEKGMGVLARYSVLPDYHDELKKRLNEILNWVKEREPGTEGKVFVDSSPLLERLMARYAGLGWIGKNTMLISPQMGSYFFIAGIAFNIELTSDKSETDHCGTCRKCIEACPTDAFPQERVLDASKCIAYYTIEHRGAIPEAVRPGIGDHVLGCDICQEVCPWNRFSEPSRVFKPVENRRLPLEELAALDGPAFRKRFGATPVERARRRGLVRNALLAMGNSGDPRHLKTLEARASDPDPILAEQASWSMGRLAAEVTA